MNRTTLSKSGIKTPSFLNTKKYTITKVDRHGQEQKQTVETPSTSIFSTTDSRNIQGSAINKNDSDVATTVIKHVEATSGPRDTMSSVTIPLLNKIIVQLERQNVLLERIIEKQDRQKDKIKLLLKKSKEEIKCDNGVCTVISDHSEAKHNNSPIQSSTSIDSSETFQVYPLQFYPFCNSSYLIVQGDKTTLAANGDYICNITIMSNDEQIVYPFGEYQWPADKKIVLNDKEILLQEKNNIYFFKKRYESFVDEPLQFSYILRLE